MKRPGLLAALLTAAAGAAGMLLPPVQLLAGGLFAYMLIAGGPLLFLLSAGLCAGFGYAVFGLSGLLLLTLFLPAALCMFFMLHRKAAYFDTALACAALYTIALYLMLGLPDILAGSPPFYTVQQMFTQMIERLAAAPAAPGSPSADQLAMMLSAGREFAAAIPIYMPACICTAGALMGLSNLLLCKGLCRRAHAPIKPMRPFFLWQLPQSFFYGTLVMGGGVLLASMLHIAALDAVIPAVFMVALLPFAIQGMSVLWFMHLARRNGMPSFLFLMLLVMIALTSVPVLGIAGLLEQLLHIRRRLIERNNPDEQD